jgi:hypothetical protein
LHVTTLLFYGHYSFPALTLRGNATTGGLLAFLQTPKHLGRGQPTTVGAAANGGDSGQHRGTALRESLQTRNFCGIRSFGLIDSSQTFGLSNRSHTGNFRGSRHTLSLRNSSHAGDLSNSSQTFDLRNSSHAGDLRNSSQTFDLSHSSHTVSFRDNKLRRSISSSLGGHNLV